MHKPEKMLGRYVREGMTVIDIGCGMGHFSIGMARMVGETGSVIAADLQQEMLDVLSSRAVKAGVAGRIVTHRCEADRIGVDGPVDFALAFWMVHETPDMGAFFREVRSILKPGGRLLVAEPVFHVSAEALGETVAVAEEAGLAKCEAPRIALCRAAVFAADRSERPSAACDAES